MGLSPQNGCRGAELGHFTQDTQERKLRNRIRLIRPGVHPQEAQTTCIEHAFKIGLEPLLFHVLLKAPQDESIPPRLAGVKDDFKRYLLLLLREGLHTLIGTDRCDGLDRG
jgi:hypothetical protein